MSDNILKCFKCRNSDRYYIRGEKRFNRIELGWCCDKCESVNAESCCGNFAVKSPCKKSERILAASLSGILTELSELRNIIEEERSERNEIEEVCEL